MFTQIIDPLGNLTLTCLVALIPVVFLLILLAVFRLPAWLATLLGSAVTFGLAVWVWQMPLHEGSLAYLYGSATGVWNVDWITFWGLILFNTLNITGVFENFRRWLIAQGSMDVRVQTMLFAWAFGALLEGLVGFGYPWAVVAPILISLGISDLNAIRVAAIANNAPVSYGALGAPIIALAAVTGYPLLALSGSVGTVVAVLALLPPWILLYLVSGKQGMLSGWPLAIVGSLGYIAGQYPVAVYLGPYLPDIAGAIVCFVALLALLKVWQPKTVLAYGGVPVDAATLQKTQKHGLSLSEVMLAWMPFVVLLVVVAAWTGPWSSLPKLILTGASGSWLLDAKGVTAQVVANAPALGATATIAAQFKFAPWVAGSAILAAWIVVVALLMALGKLKAAQLSEIFARTFKQMWGALLVGVFIFGLAYIFNFSGMASSLAKGFSSMGTAFIIVAPLLGFIGVALSGSNTSTNAMFGKFQALVGAQLGMPPLLLPTFNSVGAEIGKPIAPQTASVGVSTSKFVRKEGDVIRHNLGWTLFLLAYLVILAVGFYWLNPGVMMLKMLTMGTVTPTFIYLLLFGVGLWAGIQNALAGGGTFITFPVLLMSGLDARAANITSCVALFPGQVTTALAGRAQVSGNQHLSMRDLIVISLAGGVVGAGLLLLTPSHFFEMLVPFLVLVATGIFAWGSFVRPTAAADLHLGRPALGWSQFAIAIYGGYFGGGIGILMLAALTAAGWEFRSAGATKNVLAGVMNAAAVAVFAFSPDVHWLDAAVLAGGSIIGGQIGAYMLARVNVKLLRVFVVIVGVVLSIGLFVRAY